MQKVFLAVIAALASAPGAFALQSVTSPTPGDSYSLGFTPIEQRDATHKGPNDFNSGTDPNGGTISRGWTFTVGASNVFVNQLGLNAPDASQRTLTLFNLTTGLAVAQDVMTYTGSGWQFDQLAAPVGLLQGVSYMIVENQPAENYYWFARQSQVSQAFFPSGVINYVQADYCNQCDASFIPDGPITQYQYGLPDIGYTIGAAVISEPASLALIGAGMVGMSLVRRKRAAS